MTWAVGPLLLGAYFVGSLPTAYLLARRLLGVDIRTVGSGNVGASNLRASLGVWATVLVGVIDIAKGALPVWAAGRLGMGSTAACLAGVAVVIGHDWSVWLGFQAGRGGATTMGVLLVVFPVGALWIILGLALGAALRETGLVHLVAVLSVPLLAVVRGQTAEVVALTIALAALMVV